MRNLADQKIVIVRRATRLEGLRKRFGTASQAKFLMDKTAERESVRRTGQLLSKKRSGGAFTDYQVEDDTYRAAIDDLQRDLEGILPVQVLDRELLPSYLFGPNDIVITVGQDGLVANTAKYAVGRPLIAANPDPARFDGVLLPFRVDQVRPAVMRVMEGKASTRRVTLAEVLLSDGQKLLAFNDVFIGSRTHVSARYKIDYGARSESHSSSGVIVSTGAGSTGWLSSIFNMARGLSGLLGETKSQHPPLRLAWDDRRLAFVVREPFVSKMSAASIVSGMIAPAGELAVESQMPGGGVIFSDGIEADFLEFSSGAVARVRAADRQALLVV